MSTPTDSLLRYRPWKGEFRPPLFGAVAMARAGLTILLRRKLFWALYALVALIVFFYAFAQFFIIWLQQFADRSFVVLGRSFRVSEVARLFEQFELGGSAHTFANLIWFEGYAATVVLAFAGSVLVGNDFHHGSLPFYLSKPISGRHYVTGKLLAAGAVVNLVFTLPAVVLWVQAGLLKGWQTYYWENVPLLLGVLGYGAVLTLTLSLLLVATAVLVRRTVSLVMVWCGLFVLARIVAEVLAENLTAGATWRLIDLWNDLYLIGLWLMGTPPDVSRGGEQPPVWQAAVVVAAVCAVSWLFLLRRIRAVEVVA